LEDQDNFSLDLLQEVLNLKNNHLYFLNAKA